MTPDEFAKFNIYMAEKRPSVAEVFGNQQLILRPDENGINRIVVLAHGYTDEQYQELTAALSDFKALQQP